MTVLSRIDIIYSIVRITEFRAKRKLSQRDLAAKAKMSQAYLCNVETGKSDPSLSTLKRLAEALGVTVSELVKEPQPIRTKRA